MVQARVIVKCATCLEPTMLCLLGWKTTRECLFFRDLVYVAIIHGHRFLQTCLQVITIFGWQLVVFQCLEHAFIFTVGNEDDDYYNSHSHTLSIHHDPSYYLRRQRLGWRDTGHLSLMFKSDGCTRFGKAEAGNKDSLATLCSCQESSCKGSTISQTLYLIDHWVFNIAGKDKVVVQ